MPYADAYRLQCEHLDAVLAEREAALPDRPAGRVLLVEHNPAVITISRRPGAAAHLLASPDLLLHHAIQLEETDRGGDITYHGPGQLVVYPILDLNLLHLRLHDYMRLLEAAVIDTCAHFGVHTQRDACATGVWVPRTSGASSDTAAHACADPASSAKICAMGVRVKRWISMHGLALNVTTNLDHFNLIVPCGLAGRPVTSLHAELADRCPSMTHVKAGLVEALDAHLARHVADR